jgi:hypothetical protein
MARLVTLNNPQIEGVQLVPVEFTWSITATAAAPTVPVYTPIPSNSAVYVIPSTAAATLTQEKIDGFLGTSDEFTVAQFNATSLPANSIGFIVDMQGQALSGAWAECGVYGTNSVAGVTALAIQKEAVRRTVLATMADSTADTSFQVGVNGNFAMRVQWTTTTGSEGWQQGSPLTTATFQQLVSGIMRIKFFVQPV